MFSAIAMDKQKDKGGNAGDVVGKIRLCLQDIFRSGSHDGGNVATDGGLSCPNGPFGNSNITLGGRFGRQRRSISSRQSRYSVLPLESQNCLIPQLYGDDFEIEDYVFSPVPSAALPSGSGRALYITDGSQVISKSSYENEISNGSNGVNCQDDIDAHKRKSSRVHRRTDASDRKPDVGLLGTSDGMLIFCMGLSIGATFTTMTRRKEVDKLGDMLKQSESLVKDLQEELELKDALTVKELVNESGERQSHTHISENIQESSDPSHDDDPNMEIKEKHESLSDKDMKNSQSFRKIEAELEAELEMLELSLNKSSLESKMSAFDEIDEQIAEVVEGELCEDKLKLKYDELGESRCNSRGSTATWTPPGNYSVSPTELSLRLHELKQSILEEQIKGLESALAHSQRHLHFMESDMMYSQNASSDMGSLSTQESPTVAEQTAAAATAVAQPLCIDLSGDALDAYNEAYDEFTRISDAEERLPTPVHTSGKVVGDDVAFEGDDGISWALGYGLGSPVTDGHQEKQATKKPAENWESEFRLEDVVDGDNDDDDDMDDEEGRNLIQQIVEKSRKGSFVLDVQQMLLSMDK